MSFYGEDNFFNISDQINSENDTQQGNCLINYMVSQNPNGVRKISNKYGLPSANTEEELSQNVYDLMGNKKAIVDLIREHPDYEMIKNVVLGDNSEKMERQQIHRTTTIQPIKTQKKLRIHRNFASEVDMQIANNKLMTNLIIVAVVAFGAYLILNKDGK
jgi:hypothetical protein